MRNDSRARFQMLQLWTQGIIEPLEHVKRHHRGLGNIHRKSILSAKLDEMTHTFFHRVLARFGDQIRVQIDAHGADAVFFRRFDNNPTIAAPHVVENISLGDLRDLEHPLHDVHRRGHERNSVLRGAYPRNRHHQPEQN
jgi:hypothetical protein